MNRIDIDEFLKKYAENKHTEQEHQQFIDWVGAQSLSSAEKVLKNYYSIIKSDLDIKNGNNGALTKESREQLLHNIEQAIARSNTKAKIFGLNSILKGVAALLIVAIAAGYYLYKQPQQANHKNVAVIAQTATSLILQNGTTVNLDSLKTGEQIEQGAIKVHKTGDGQLVYEILANVSGDNETNDYNTIQTANGRQAFVALADGTKVWLNAASSFKFPVNFTKKERIVELEGEAYFEVSKEKRAFKVVTNKQEIEVLGTHFNIDAYNDNPHIKTTLLEGAVRVNSSKLKRYIVLRPGEQSIEADGELAVKQVDAEETIAWKDGMFVFSNEPIHTVMKEIARWYNVEVVYQGKVTREKFVMNISKSEDMIDVLKKLELTGLVNFKIVKGTSKERRVIVMP